MRTPLTPITNAGGIARENDIPTRQLTASCQKDWRLLKAFHQNEGTGRMHTLQFIKYVVVGVGNTLIHWLIFLLMYQLVTTDQVLCNAAAFIVAVTASFIVNARWTFKKVPSGRRYLCFVGFMGLVAISVGAVADATDVHPMVTLVTFSGLSLVLGFLFSKFMVFKEVKE
ncbi:GtrA family protein [Pseudomonas rhizosphaerae]|uniref:GtrA family protein n=1 Tax=Pseudomonas rhizosphaerae TaxID=216142 RepID=UPI002B496F0E|nr:GtrA family protein [Pseudomonas rhizosphaerae]MEB2869650.1 GtrA family protein [Pseudomonas rhizosphaerae]